MKTVALAACILALACAAAPALADPDVAAPTPAAGPDGGPALTAVFQTEARTGRIMVALFDGAEAYAAGRPVRHLLIEAGADADLTAAFQGLPAGDYAIKAFHDLDGDGRMNTNPFGMPTEPFAFSNDAVGNMGPARWDQARFAVSGPTVQTIRIR